MPHPILTAAVVAIGVIAAAVLFVFDEQQSNSNEHHRNNGYTYSSYARPPRRTVSANYNLLSSASCSADVSSSRPRKRKRSYDGNCAICLESLTSSLATFLICQHAFHENCITTWLREGNKSCPLCRQPAVISFRRSYVS